MILGFFPETGLEPLPRADAPANRNNAPQTADIIQEVNFMVAINKNLSVKKYAQMSSYLSLFSEKRHHAPGALEAPAFRRV